MAFRDLTTYQSEESSHKIHTLEISENHSVTLPDSGYVQDSTLIREGSDLILKNDQGDICVKDYFTDGTPPTLSSPDGMTLTPQLVQSFLSSDSRYASTNATSNDESPIGAVQEIAGDATVTHLDGTTSTIGPGTAIYAGDVVETGENGVVNIMFVDETTFAVSEDSKISIDEYVFDPSTQSGTNNFSVLKGMFVFTSGLIGRDDPDDVHINTPSGSIGIRGTIIAGNVDNGEITVIEGAIVLQDHNGNSITLASEYETAKFGTHGEDIKHIGNLSAHEISNKFASISVVSGTLFAGLSEKANDEAAKLAQGNEEQTQDPSQGNEETAQEDLANQDLEDGFNNSEDIEVAEITNDLIKPTVPLTEKQNIQLLDETRTSALEAPKEPIPLQSNEFVLKFDSKIVTTPVTENITDVKVATISGLNSELSFLTILGVSKNFFRFERVDSNTFNIFLKSGVSLDHENLINLDYRISNGKGEAFTKSVRMNAVNVDEALTHHESTDASFFSATNETHWSYDFSKDFNDPDSSVTYTFNYLHTNSSPVTNPSGEFNIQSSSFDNSTGVAHINFGNTTPDSTFILQVTATSASGTITQDYTFNTLTGTTTSNHVSSAETYYDASNANNNVYIIGDHANVFTSGGNDTITISDDHAMVQSGIGSDKIIFSSGENAKVFGEAGNDDFKFNTSYDTTKTNLIDGGDGYDTIFILGGQNLDLTAAGNHLTLKNIESIDTHNGYSNTVKLTYNQVIEITDNHNTLKIDSGGLDTFEFVNTSGNQFFLTGQQTEDGSTFNVYTDGVVTLLIDTDVGAQTGVI